jgi:ribonuclease P protein component
MLPKSHRLPLRSLPDFFTQAQKLHNRFFTLFYRTTPSLTRATVVIPKKAISAASGRNLVKRQLRETLRPLVVDQTGLELVVVVKAAATQVNPTELAAELTKSYQTLIKRK